MLTAIRDFTRSVSQDVERFLQAFRTIERLPALLAENHNTLLHQMSALSQILSGIEFLITENAALKAALGESGLTNEALQAELAAAGERYKSLVSEEVAEDEMEARILSRLSEVLPQPAAEEPVAEEPVAPAVEPAAEEPAAEEEEPA
jgi:hypothetical protein